MFRPHWSCNLHAQIPKHLTKPRNNKLSSATQRLWEDSVRATRLFRSASVAVISLCLAASLPAQTATPSANLTTVRLIPVPGWTTAAGAFDLASFDPANRIMYFADGTNHAVTSVDTVTNTLISSISPPDCTAANCPSGIQVAPDLQKLVVT